MLSSLNSYSAPRWSAPPALQQKGCHNPQHEHSDCYVPGQAPPEIYSRRSMTSQLALVSPQMGDWAPGSFESAQFTMGDEPAGQQTQWSEQLGSVPKDCYYCRTTGKCSQDVPEWGGGKDYMGQSCNACRGTGKCSHCDGDGVIG